MNCVQPLTAHELAFVVGYVCMGITAAAMAVALLLNVWADFRKPRGGN